MAATSWLLPLCNPKVYCARQMANLCDCLAIVQVCALTAGDWRLNPSIRWLGCRAFGKSIPNTDLRSERIVN